MEGLEKQESNSVAVNGDEVPVVSGDETSVVDADEVPVVDADETSGDDGYILIDDEVLEDGPGIYPQDDGTVDIRLSKPLKTKNSVIEVVKVTRAPNVKETDKAGGRAALLNLYDGAHISVMPAITEPSITAAIFQKMNGADTTNLMGGVVHFFVNYQSGES